MSDKKIDKLQKRVAELEEQWKRALADYANLEKRMNRDRQNVVDFANESVIDKMLFVFIDIQRACKNINNKGLTMIKNDFWEVLSSEGVKRIKTEKKIFDPNLMDAVAMVKGKDNKVVKEVTPGYLYKGRCIRPAKVKVGAKKAS